MPNTEIIEKWVTALESGEYEQTQGRLQKKYPSGQTGFCCLGVLCDLAVKEGVIPEPEMRGTPERQDAWYGRDGDHTDLALPESVRIWAGFEESDPYVEYPETHWDDETNEEVIRTEEETLATLNDSGKSFSEIAQLIGDNFLTEK